jgi:hypothetical protein
VLADEPSMNATCHKSARRGHTLMEMVVAMVCSGVLLAGLASVMFISQQVAYAPSAAVHRTKAAEVVHQISEELRCATLIIQQTPQILEFVVADRNGDGTAEKIRYEWSGTPGAPLNKKVNAASSVPVLGAVEAFGLSLQQTSNTTTLKTRVDSAEAMLISNPNSPGGSDRTVTSTRYMAQQINPAAFTSPVPANALYWNATKVQFFGDKDGNDGDILVLQLRSTGEPGDAPSSDAIGEKVIAESTLNSGWNTIVFTSPVQNLAFQRRYAIAWSAVGSAARLKYDDNFASGVLESTDAGATWQFMTTRQLFYRLYGTYTTPGPTYNVTRSYVSHVGLVLQTSSQSHGRIDASIPLANMPELVSSYWRADFSTNPAATNANGDSVADWAVAGGGNFDTSRLINGVWYASGALETRPLNDFTTTTTVEMRCRNTTVGGNGAVVRINADRQGGLYAPLLVYVQRQADGTQNVSLLGKTSDAATKSLFARSRLTSDFLRLRLTIVPQSNVVNLQINDEDQGTFTYPTYAPSSATDRFVTLYADTSLAEFDYVDVRVATN